MNKIYNINNHCKTPMSLQELRERLPNDVTNALAVVDHLKTIISNEHVVRDKLVQVDVSEGSYVKAIEFHSTTKLTFHFNEGSVQEMDQSDGIYAIGEHVYNFNQSNIGTKDLHYVSHNQALSKLQNREFVKIQNAEWIEILYKNFPDARKNSPDALYNINDASGACKRIEHFRAYYIRSLSSALSKIQDQPSMAVCLIECSPKSRVVYEDLLMHVNSTRKNRISLCDTEDQLIEGYGYVYYLRDIMVFPASLDHGVCIKSGMSNFFFDPSMLKGLDRDSVFITRNSSVILGSYTPIMDAYIGKDGYCMHSVSSDYDYSQFYYVPHKPWVFINIGTKEDMYLIKGSDSSKVGAADRLKYRTLILRIMSVLNIKRNVIMATSEVRDKMLPSSELCELLMGGIDIHNVALFKTMKGKVRLMAKKLAYREVAAEVVVRIPVLMNDLVKETDYSQNELLARGWDSNMIARALELQVLTLYKDGSLIKYRRYTRTAPRYLRYLERQYITDSSCATILNSDGSVSARGNEPDSRIYVLPFIKLENKKDFNRAPPYDNAMFKGPPVPGKDLAFGYESNTCLEFNEEPQSVKNIFSHKKPKGREKKKYPKRVAMKSIQTSSDKLVKVKNKALRENNFKSNRSRFKKKEFGNRKRPPDKNVVLDVGVKATFKSKRKKIRRFDSSDLEVKEYNPPPLAPPELFDDPHEYAVYKRAYKYGVSKRVEPMPWVSSGPLLFSLDS